MKIIGKKTLASRVYAVVATALTLFFVFTFAACANGDGGNGGPQGGSQNLVAVTGTVRDVSFRPLAEDIYYDGKKVGRSDDNGHFEVKVANTEEKTLTQMLSVAEHSFAYCSYNDSGMYAVLVKTEKDFRAEDFVMIGGKIVLHSDGETVASGVELRIDGVKILVTGNNRNFDLAFIYKESVLSVYKEGGNFVDINSIPYSEVSVSTLIGNATESQKRVVNGEDVQIKCVSGVTFRLANSANA